MERLSEKCKTQFLNIEDDQPTLPKIQEIATLVTCALCGGYLTDATTITGCLHSFCHACIIAHLEVRKTCPTCDAALDSSHPKFSLRSKCDHNNVSFVFVEWNRWTHKSQQDLYRLNPELFKSRCFGTILGKAYQLSTYVALQSKNSVWYHLFSNSSCDVTRYCSESSTKSFLDFTIRQFSGDSEPQKRIVALHIPQNVHHISRKLPLHGELNRRVELAERLCKTGVQYQTDSQCRAIWGRKRSDLDCRSVIYCDNDYFSIALHYGLDTGSTKLLPITPEVMQIIKHSEYPPCSTRLTTYLQCPARLTVRVVKKFVRLKYEVGPSFTVELFSGSGERIDDHYTLIDVAYVFTGRKVGSLQLHYLVVNRNSICKKLSSETLCGSTEEISSPPIKRKRGRPPKRISLDVSQSKSSNQEVKNAVVNDIRENLGIALQDVSRCCKLDSERDKSVSSDIVSLPYSVSTYAVVRCGLADNPQISVKALNTSHIENECSCEDASMDSVHAGNCSHVEPRQLCNAVFGQRTDTEVLHPTYQPMVVINPFVGPLFNSDGFVFPGAAIDSGINPGFQLVSLLNVPCFIGDVGLKTDCDPMAGAMLEVIGDQTRVIYPDVYGCSLSQQRDSSKSISEARHWTQDCPSYWRIEHETIEAQHFRTLTPDIPSLPSVESNYNRDDYVSVLNSLTSVAPGKILTICEDSVGGNSPELEPNSSVLIENGFMPAASALTYVAESFEVSEAIAKCTDVDDTQKSDVTMPHRVRHLSSVCSHQKVVGASLNVEATTAYLESFSRQFDQDWQSLTAVSDSLIVVGGLGSSCKMNGIVSAEGARQCASLSDPPATPTHSEAASINSVSNSKDQYKEYPIIHQELDLEACPLQWPTHSYLAGTPSSCTAVPVGHCSYVDCARENCSEL